MSKQERQSNIELLRIFAIMGVIVLHYNNPMIGGGIVHAREGSINFYILYFLESLFVCGVNLFMLISGYFMCESKKRNLWKPIELIAQVIIFRESIYLFRVIIGNVSFSLKTLVATLLPVNYFVILYCTVFIISPFINTMLNHLSDRAFKVLIISTVTLFSIYPTLIDVIGELRGAELFGLSSVGMYGSQWGYSIVNFVLMYLIGAYLKREKGMLQNWSTGKLIAGLVTCIILMMIWARINDKIGFFTERSAWEYCNPLVIAEAVFVFYLFKNMNLRINKVINKLAEGAFTVFLLHQVFIPYLKIDKFVTGNPAVMILHIVSCVVGIYFICWALHIVYHLISDLIFKALSAKIKIPLIDAEI